MRAVILGASALALCLAGSPRRAARRRRTGRHRRGPPRRRHPHSRSAPASGSKWSHTWPVPIKAADVPLALDGIPKRWWGKPGAHHDVARVADRRHRVGHRRRAADLVSRPLPAGRRAEDVAHRPAAAATADDAAVSEAGAGLVGAAHLPAHRAGRSVGSHVAADREQGRRRDEDRRGRHDGHQRHEPARVRPAPDAASRARQGARPVSRRSIGSP